MDDDKLPLSVTEIREKMISSFMENTSSSREEAKSFLESHQWDLYAAVSVFMDNNFAEAIAAAEANVTNTSDTQLLSTVATRTRYLNLRIDISVSSHSQSNSSVYIPSPSRSWLRSPSHSNLSRDRNPFSLKREADTPCESETNKRRELAGNKPAVAEISGESNDSDSDDYDGGEQSGRTIMQEPEEGEDVDDKDEESDEERHVQSSSRITSRVVPAEPKVILTFVVTIWRNGFTVDNGPLITMDNPGEAAFVESVQRLESPRDLNPKDNQIRHRIKLIRRQEEDFNESPKFTPFQGVGRTLAGSDSAATEPPASSESLTTTPLPSMSQVVDPAAPTTSIHDTATILQLCSLYSGATTIIEKLEEGEDDDDKDKESAEPELVIRSTITLYRNGFTLDDDPFNTMDNLDDAAFIELVHSLESPRDLNPEDNQFRYRVKLIMREEEDFNGENQPDLNPEDNQESPKFTPFQGVGRTLSGSDSAATEPPASSDSLITTTPPSMNLVVDPAAPITSIQFRLADGKLISSRFNTHHTVRDVRGFIDASRPGGSNDYQLLMGFPPKPLLDFDQTIEKAGISNSVLIQKY